MLIIMTDDTGKTLSSFPQTLITSSILFCRLSLDAVINDSESDMWYLHIGTTFEVYLNNIRTAIKNFITHADSVGQPE